MNLDSTIRQLYFAFFLISTNLVISQNHPGGVTGSEVWYIADWYDISIGEYINSAETDILIHKCSENDKDLFNFNSSIYSDNLCLYYNAILENSTGRDVFFVGEPYKGNNYSYSHLGTLWDQNLQGNFQTDSIIRNFFDFNNKTFYTKKVVGSYTSDQLARVNFYHSNYYNIDKKFKSYGEKGETVFFLGKLTSINSNENYEDNNFHGNFPEFISFPRELNENERNRIESYLALKYGLTLSKYVSYVSSKNIIFWNKENNNLFGNRIFGLGADKASGLSQLQSESTHLKKHLVSAIEDIMNTNMEKQKQTSIPYEHFLVFGDNGELAKFDEPNNHSVYFWNKIWLAQRTGRDVNKFPIHFKLSLEEQMQEYLASHPEERIWLLQDRYVGNDEVSDFNNENLEYYEGEINLQQGYAYFKDVFFDTDFNVYDQFTFGVGPQMIVQAQIEGCKGGRLNVNLDITGGKPKYCIEVTSEAGNFEECILDSEFSFSVEPDVLYNITVVDDQGVIFQLELIPEPWDFSLDLGGTQYLSSVQPEIILDAGQGIDDPDATYEWYLNDNLLSNTDSTLTVSEVGEYKVVVTSGDLSCSIEDEVLIEYLEFMADFSITQLCGSEYSNTLFVYIEGGFPPYITSVDNGQGFSINHAHSGNSAIVDVPYGNYQITVTDSNGQIFEGSIEFLEAEEIILDVYSQLESVCNLENWQYICMDYSYPNAPLFNFIAEDFSFSIDASAGITNQNIEYQWYVNDDVIGVSGSVLTLSSGFNCYDGSGNNPIYTVVATDVVFGCVETQSFVAKGFCPNEDGGRPATTISTNETENNNWLKTMVYPNPTEKNHTFIYEVFSSKAFEGRVELYSVTGALLYNVQLNSSKNHKIPFKLDSAGVYLIKTITGNGEVKTNRVIIN